jgi:hypothetical protein
LALSVPARPVAASATLTLCGVTYRLVPLTQAPEGAAPDRRPSTRTTLTALTLPHGNGANDTIVDVADTALPQRLRGAERISNGRELGRPRKPRSAEALTPQAMPREPQIEPVTMRQHLAGKRYGVSGSTIKKWTASGEVDSRKVGRMRLVVMASLRRRLGLDE